MKHRYLLNVIQEREEIEMAGVITTLIIMSIIILVVANIVAVPYFVLVIGFVAIVLAFMALVMFCNVVKDSGKDEEL